MEAASFAKTAVTNYQSTWCHNSEYCNIHPQCCETLKPHKLRLGVMADHGNRAAELLGLNYIEAKIKY